MAISKHENSLLVYISLLILIAMGIFLSLHVKLYLPLDNFFSVITKRLDADSSGREGVIIKLIKLILVRM